MKQKSSKQILQNKYSLVAVVLFALSLTLYLIEHYINGNYYITDIREQYATFLFMTSLLSFLGSIANFVAIFKVPKWWKLLFAVGVLMCLAIGGLQLLAAAFTNY